MEDLSQFVKDLPAWAQLVMLVVTLASSVTAVTPTRYKNPVLDYAFRFLNLLSLNVFKNKNADSDSPPKA
jgi:hypothetical protein